MTDISVIEWVKRFKPVRNPSSSDPGFWGHMFETFGADLEYMKSTVSDDRHLWTMVDGEGRSLYLFNGVHWVNRLGYFVTEVPWEGEVNIYDV
jgi:hypothetical protein